MKVFSRIYLAFLLLLMYAPVVALIVFSFTPSRIFGKWMGFSLELYSDLLSGSNPQIINALVTTILIMLAVVSISVVIGTTAAIGFHYNRRRLVRRSAYSMNTLSIATPDIVAAVALFTFYIFAGVSRGAFTVILSQSTVCVPFVFMCVLPILQKMDSEMYEASADLGASLWMTLTRVILPQIKSGIVSGALLSAVLSLDDFAVTLFSRSNDGFETLSTLIYTDARRGTLTPEFRPLYSIIIAVMLVLLFFYQKRSKR